MLYSKIVLRFFLHFIQNMETKLTPDGYNQASSYVCHIIFPSELSDYGKWVTKAVLLGQTKKSAHN